MAHSPLVSLERVETYDLDRLRVKLQNLLLPWGGMSALLPRLPETQQPRVLLKPNLLTGSNPQNEKHSTLHRQPILATIDPRRDGFQ